MNVEHFMTKNPVAVEANASVREVAQQMRDKNVGSVVVLSRGKVVGMVTDRQLATRALADGDADMEAREVMTESPARITLEDNLFSVLDTFRSAGVVHRLPVVNENDELLGVVSLSDVAVVAKPIVDALMMDQTHHALAEARVMTGGKEIVKKIRRPTKAERLKPDVPIRPTTAATPPGATPKSGGVTWPRTRPESERRTRERVASSQELKRKETQRGGHRRGGKGPGPQGREPRGNRGQFRPSTAPPEQRPTENPRAAGGRARAARRELQERRTSGGMIPEQRQARQRGGRRGAAQRRLRRSRAARRPGAHVGARMSGGRKRPTRRARAAGPGRAARRRGAATRATARSRKTARRR